MKQEIKYVKETDLQKSVDKFGNPSLIYQIAGSYTQGTKGKIIIFPKGFGQGSFEIQIKERCIICIPKLNGMKLIRISGEYPFTNYVCLAQAQNQSVKHHYGRNFIFAIPSNLVDPKPLVCINDNAVLVDGEIIPLLPDMEYLTSDMEYEKYSKIMGKLTEIENIRNDVIRLELQKIQVVQKIKELNLEHFIPFVEHSVFYTEQFLDNLQPENLNEIIAFTKRTQENIEYDIAFADKLLAKMGYFFSQADGIYCQKK